MHCNARSRPFLDLKVTVRSNLKFNVQLVPVFPLDVFLEHPEQKYLGKASMEKNVFFRALPEKGGGLPMPEFLALFQYII